MSSQNNLLMATHCTALQGCWRGLGAEREEEWGKDSTQPGARIDRCLMLNDPAGSRMRNTKTEYVSCPSCGRTLFDLQQVTDQIPTKTGHLPGVSIAVMG